MAVTGMWGIHDLVYVLASRVCGIVQNTKDKMPEANVLEQSWRGSIY